MTETDIIERLDRAREPLSGDDPIENLLLEAADEIGRLREALRKKTAADRESGVVE